MDGDDVYLFDPINLEEMYQFDKETKSVKMVGYGNMGMHVCMYGCVRKCTEVWAHGCGCICVYVCMCVLLHLLIQSLTLI